MHDQMAATTSTSTSSVTTHRPSLTRPRLSLGTPTINSASELTRAASSFASNVRPGLPATGKSSVSAVRTAPGKKLSQAHLTPGSVSAVRDSTRADGPPLTQDSGSSASAMQPLSSPPMSRVVNGDRAGNRDLEVGDMVDVPGGMHGTVKFIGEVKGKKGIFAGVELSREWAARGKNDGDVEG